MKNPRPFLVGITGGIGSGKSTVAKVFSILGIPVYFADERAKWLMANDALLKKNIIDAFGEESYTDRGILNREFLGRHVFGDENRVNLINSLVHPAVRTDFEAWSSNQESPYVLKEAALLFETGSFKELDKIITVSAPLKLRMMRVLLRDPHRNEAQINAIIDQQLPDEEKNKKADFVIKNSENKLLIPQVLKIHQELLALANR
jgi:dephospho-CoA kinase